MATALLLTVWLGGLAQAGECHSDAGVRLLWPVTIEPQERAALASMAPLRVTSVGAPPLSVFDPQQGRYSGIAVDVLCFVADQLGLQVEFVPAHELTVKQKIAQVQQGELDMFMPLSLVPERERAGLFTVPFYDSHYVAIARKGRRLELAATADLARYRVGVVDGVALLPLLRSLVPAQQLVIFTQSFARGGLFDALQDGQVDVAVFNGDFFSEQRYRHELFDLQTVHTLREQPAAYRFYFSRSPQHERVVAAFNRYLAAIDIGPSLQVHLQGERRLLERYVYQRSQRTLLQAASVVVALLALAAFAALRHHRQLARRLAQQNAHILLQQEKLLAANRELQQLSQTDGLTRLANRRHFDHALVREHARCQRTGTPLSLLMVDLDHFKRVNDHYGHAVGDDYLRAVARTLQAGAARATDLAARYGGEEFVCLLPDTGPPEAAAVAERIRAAVQALALPNAQADIPTLTVSIGGATLASGAYEAHELLAQADAQLYAAKHAGRNQVRCTVLHAEPKQPPALLPQS